MKTTNAKQLREMAADNLEATHKDAIEQLFRLQLRAQTEKLEAPSELRRLRRLIARIETLKRERALTGLNNASPEQAATAVQEAKQAFRTAREERTTMAGPRWRRRKAGRAFARAKAAAVAAKTAG